MNLRALPGLYAVCKLEHLPAALPESGFWCLAHTDEEISLVCPEDAIPAEAVRVERGWRAIAAEGPLEFSLTGILAGLTRALAAAEIALFAVSTYDTDCLLIPSRDFDRALEALRSAGHRIIDEGETP